MDAIILAGGFGTRLQSVVSDVPKSMALVNGKPFLAYMFENLLLHGIQRVVLAVGYKHEVIRDHFQFAYKQLEIDYSVENEPLGTGGAIRLAFWKISGDRALVLNGDSMFRVNYRQMYDQHIKKCAEVTIAVLKTQDAGRYGTIIMNRSNLITGFKEKSPTVRSGLINGGVYYVEKQFIMNSRFRGKFSLEKDCFETLVEESRFYGFRENSYFLDIGIPSDYNKAQNDFVKFSD
jgi:D-glycero-alpha-D-manno-heptose 1-phosphate guanylyltransferase